MLRSRAVKYYIILYFLFNVCSRYNDSFERTMLLLKFVRSDKQMLWSTHSEIQIVVLQILVARILQNSAFLSNRMHLFNSSGNLDKFSMDRMSRNMIELAARFECPTDLRYFFHVL